MALHGPEHREACPAPTVTPGSCPSGVRGKNSRPVPPQARKGSVRNGDLGTGKAVHFSSPHSAERGTDRPASSYRHLRRYIERDDAVCSIGIAESQALVEVP